MSDQHRVNLPEEFAVTDLQRDASIVARLVSLSRESAKRNIDERWWEVEGVPAQRLRQETDYEWKWKVLVSKFQNKPYVRSVAVLLEDGAVEGAMIYRVDGKSVLEPGNRAVLIERLATAPRNRDELTEKPRYRGVGTGLLRYALCQSYSLGFQGRLNLFAAGDEQFYLDRGFIRTGIVYEEMPFFELPQVVALNQLREMGMLP